MATTLVTAPAKDLVTLVEIKEFLRIKHDEENSILRDAINAGHQAATELTGKQFVTATYDLTLDFFPLVIVPDFPPLQSVTSITYVDTDGDTQTVDSADYILDIASSPARITPAYGVSWPATRVQVNAVTVRYVCGIDDPAGVDPRAKMLVKYLSVNWYEIREPLSEKNISEFPWTIQSLASQLRRVEFV